MTREQQFQRELEVFRTAAEQASQFLFGYFAVHAVAYGHKQVHRILNTAPLFWNTALGALQTSAHIALGRILDQNSKHNVDAVLRIAQGNIDIFSKQALAKRKQTASANAAEWIDDYLKTAYDPGPEDFRRLRAHVAKRRKIYDAKYRDIRNHFAHKIFSDRADIEAIFSKTKVDELQRLCVFFQRLHEALWQLYNNGGKPILQPMRHSANRILDLPSPKGGRETVQERLSQEAKRFLLAAAKEQS